MPRVKTRQEIAYEYGISRVTFYRLMKKLDIQISSGLVTPVEQQMVYDALGYPDQVKNS